MAKKTEYEVLCDQITKNVKETGSSRYSKGDYVDMAQAMLNSPEYAVDYRLKEGNKKEPTTVTSEPVKKFRESLVPMLRAAGIDKTEADKIVQETVFPKKTAESFCECASLLVKDYTRTQRKLILPITTKDESQMEISQVVVPKKASNTNKIVKDEAGNFSIVPTGKNVETLEHRALKATNKIPYWLKTETILKK